MALRMLVGLGNSDTGNRITLVRRITDVATEYGLGLQIADRRFGRVRGEWWEVLKPNRDKYERMKSVLFARAPRGVPKSVRLLTFVGPARIGSSAAVTDDFVARNIGILAVSETSLQEIAFINLVVPILPNRLTGGNTSSVCQSIGDGFGPVADECGLGPSRSDQRAGQDPGSPATDYQMLSTGPVMSGIEESPGGGEHPLWLSWTVPAGPKTTEPAPDVADLVLAQLRRATGLVRDGRIDYYRARVLPDDRVRGRAKITVSLAEGTGKRRIPMVLSELCPWAQRHVVASLVGYDVPFRLIRIRLAWRERWLGRASTVM
jgi:hypothetical protein